MAADERPPEQAAHHRSREMAGWGVLVAASCLAAWWGLGLLSSQSLLGDSPSLSEQLSANVSLFGLAVLVAAGGLVDAGAAPPWFGGLLAIAGAELLAFHGGLPEVLWIRVLVLVGIPVAGFLASRAEVAAGRGGPSLPSHLSPLMFTLSVGGLYLTVPDTEEALALLGVTLVLALAAWPLGMMRLGAGGAYAVAGAFLWTAAVGGAARPASIVGATGALGMLVLSPIVVALRRPDSRSFRSSGLLLSIHAAVVAVASRIAGLQDHAILAAGIVLGVWATVLLGYWVTRTTPPDDRIDGEAEERVS